MKTVVLSVIVALVLIGGALMLEKSGSQSEEVTPQNNVSIVNGTQIVDIRAKGGYQPNKSVAQAGIPTIIRFNTKGTFDCSASVRIPSLNVSKILPQSGQTEISIGSQNPGTLVGSCGMGMYPFEIEFKA
jgi:plastocyanin domain-containing protein